MMRIVIVTECYSIGMGHTENSLPKALARLGHEVHLISSNLNIYGNLPTYKTSTNDISVHPNSRSARFRLTIYCP